MAEKFPNDRDLPRLRRYSRYEKLLVGDSYQAFVEEVGDNFTRKYKYLRYLSCNFAGLISKVIADVLFGETVDILSQGGNAGEQNFIQSLVYENKLDTQFYESALMNSARGDALLRVRVEENQIKIEDINPAMYFPEVKRNYRQEPNTVILAWKETIEIEKPEHYLIKEIHTKGLIETRIYRMKDDGNEISERIDISIYNKLTGSKYIDFVETGIDEIPLVFIPNYRSEGSYWGTSDYRDLESLFFGINNRMTKIDNILDKHSDPIIAVPEGILDENGNVEKEALGMIEVREGEGKPEYIVWNANLESAFTEIEKMVEMVFLFGEVSPDVLGIGDSKPESGRALKMRMLRTLAKKNRKQLYYSYGIQKAVEIASKFANAGYMSGDIKYRGDDIVPLVKFADGVIDDKVEEIENESIKVQSDLTSRKRAIMKIEDTGEKEADAILEEIKKEKKESSDFSSEELFHLQAKQIRNEPEESRQTGEIV